jgi:hypothetical protein
MGGNLKIFRQIKNIGFLLAILSFSAYAIASDKDKEQFDAHLEKLLEREKKGGQLYCEYETGDKRESFKSCESFLLLKKKGCYGNSTYEMSIEFGYSDLCKEIEILRKAKPATANYFKIDSDDWWKTLPAEIIPMPGGIYNDSSWEVAKVARDKLVEGKILGQISFSKVSATKGSLEAVISISKEECGDVEDYFKISTAQVADFNGDGLADLLLKGYRVDRSDSCNLGSGNSLGAGFSVLVQKKGANETPVIISQNTK